MTDLLPPDVMIKQVFVVEATYAPDAAERRAPYRGRHLQRIADLLSSGALVLSGAYADLSASIMVLHAQNSGEAEAVAREDVYFAEGIWTRVVARSFDQVRLRSEQR